MSFGEILLNNQNKVIKYSDFSDPCTEVYPYRRHTVPVPSLTVLNRLQPYFIVLSYFNIIHIDYI
jgi:hypothetical protein